MLREYTDNLHRGRSGPVGVPISGGNFGRSKLFVPCMVFVIGNSSGTSGRP